MSVPLCERETGLALSLPPPLDRVLCPSTRAWKSGPGRSGASCLPAWTGRRAGRRRGRARAAGHAGEQLAPDLPGPPLQVRGRRHRNPIRRRGQRQGQTGFSLTQRHTHSVTLHKFIVGRAELRQPDKGHVVCEPTPRFVSPGLG